MRHWKIWGAAVMAAGMALSCPVVFAADYEGYTQEEFEALDKTTVIRSEDSPTGYYVTFRYKDSDASRVRIYGEWSFSDILDATYYTSTNATPEEWQDGYTIWKTGSWPTADMVKNEETGIWSYTIPLPNGTWCYRYYIDGVEGAELEDYTDAEMIADPNNINYLADDTVELGKEECLTSIYVPYDEEKQANTIPHMEEAPRDGENGTVSFVEDITQEGAETSYGVYLPYGFDQDRDEAYPILVLFHGGSGYDGSWLSNGLANILDNMIAEGRIEPTIVVTPNANDFPNESYRWDRPAILDYIVNSLLPYMSENYNASTDPARRAFAGLSMGGATAGYALFNNTDDFGTFIIFSAPFLGDVQPDYTMPELKEKNIFIGYGDYDFVAADSMYKLEPDEEGNPVLLLNYNSPMNKEGSVIEYINGLGNEGVPFKTMHYPYGHDWVLWRKLLVDAFDSVLWK